MANENAITKIQLKTKTSLIEGENAVALSDIPLALGEPLVNTNDNTIIIGTSFASDAKANNTNAILLGKSADEIIQNPAADSGDPGITIKHYDGNKERYSRTVKGVGATVAASDGNIEIDASYSLSEEDSESGTTITLSGNNINDSAVTVATKNIVGETGSTSDTAVSASANGVYLNHIENSKVQSSHKISGANGVTIGSDASGNITVKQGDINVGAGYKDDNVVILVGTTGINSVTYEAKHATKGPSTTASTTKGATSDISATAGAGTKTIKVPKVTVDKYGHTTDLTEETLSITIPGAGTGLKTANTDSAVKYEANLNSTTSLGTLGSTSKLYAVGVDSAGYLAVNVPWANTQNDNDNQTVKGNGTAFGINDAVDIVGSGATTVTANPSAKTITVSSTDTGATSIAFSGNGNALTNASYDANARKLTFTKGATYNNYSLPTATAAQKGGIKVGNHLTISSEVLSVNPDFGSSVQIKAGSFNAYSDIRLKENFQPLIPEKSVLDLPLYKFDFIDGAKNQIGCKAQDLQEICPEIVDEGSDGYLSIKESKIIYLLLDEVKKLKKEIDKLKGI